MNAQVAVFPSIRSAHELLRLAIPLAIITCSVLGTFYIDGKAAVAGPAMQVAATR